MRRRWLAVLAATVVTATGCGHHSVTRVQRPSPTPTVVPSYDAALPPAQAVLALIPAAATSVSLTDFDQVRAAYGVELTSASPAADRKTFWREASAHSPLLSSGMLRPYAKQLTGFGQDDVAWEAHYSGGGADGWVLSFRDSLGMGVVRKAVAAGVGPLAGATVDGHLATSRSLPASDARWSGLAGLAGPAAESTYLAKGCLAGETGGELLSPLKAYGVSFGGTVATAYLGPGRDDLFTRMRLGSVVPAFSHDFVNGTADPSSGRIGFTMTDPADAAQQALRGKLPFAVCAD